MFHGRMSDSAFSVTDGSSSRRSTSGEKRISPAGSTRWTSSGEATTREVASPPPPESPATKRRPGGTPAATMAASTWAASRRPAGNGNSGASR